MAKTLLAVEDSRTMRRVLEITFSSSEFAAEVVETAQDALAQLDRVSPDAVLVDISLPGTNGYEVCRQLKSRQPNLPVLLMSSTQQPYDPARGAEVYADDYIDKPFDTQQLRDKVTQLCARAKQAGAAQPGAATSGASSTRPGAARSVPPPLPAVFARSAPSRPSGSVPAPLPAARTESGGMAPLGGPGAGSVSAGVAGSAIEEFGERLSGLGLTAEQTVALLALSREVVEKVVWEVVPTLAETLIKEEIARLTRP